MAKRGRPPAGEYPEKKRVFASRIREDTWRMLQQAAATSGRSVSQEFEHRLRRGLDDDKAIENDFGDRRTLAVMKMAAMAAVNSARLNPTQPKQQHWTANATAFDRALKAIVDVVGAFRPLVVKDAEMRLEAAAPTLELVRHIRAADPSRPLTKQSKRQRALLRLKDELGDLVDRPARLLKVQKPTSERKKKK